MILDRFYYRAYVYYTSTLDYTGQRDVEAHVAPSIMLSLFLAAWAMAILFVMKFLGYIEFGQGRLAPNDGQGDIYVLGFVCLFMLVCHIYFISSGRWKRIVKDFSFGGRRYSRLGNRLVDTFCVLPFLLVFSLVFFI